MKTNSSESVLPLVYRVGHTFEVSNRFDPDRRKDLWGIQILPGVIMSLAYGKVETAKGLVPATWQNVRDFTKRLGSVHLPSGDFLKERWGAEDEVLLKRTLRWLDQCDVEVGVYMGCCWCDAAALEERAGIFSFAGGSFDTILKSEEKWTKYIRIVTILG